MADLLKTLCKKLLPLPLVKQKMGEEISFGSIFDHIKLTIMFVWAAFQLSAICYFPA